MEILSVGLLLVYLSKKKSFQMMFKSVSVCQFVQWWRQTIPNSWPGRGKWTFSKLQTREIV